MNEHTSDVIGLDVGGTFLKAARVDPEGRILAHRHEPIAHASAEALLDQLAAAVAGLEGRDGAVKAIGVGLPGIVERNARVRAAPALPFLDGLAVAEALSKRTGRPAFLENDANAAALAEAWRGAGGGASNLIFVALGTGVGAGVILGGRVWSGRSGYAGELGHVQIDPNGVRCNCGSWGCVETFAGAPHWKRRAELALAGRESTLHGTALDPKAIVAAAQNGDAVALEVVDGAARALGTGIAAALSLLNLESVVIGGGVSAAGPFLLDRIVEQTRRRVFPQVFADCAFRLTALGSDAGVVGAARVGIVGVTS